MSEWGRAAARVVFAAACVALAAVPEPARGQHCKDINLKECAEQFGAFNPRLWDTLALKRWKRALEVADWDVSSEPCFGNKEYVERTKKAVPAAFASAFNEDAPIPEWFIMADSLQDSVKKPVPGAHVVIRPYGKENHLFMTKRNSPDIFSSIVHEMAHHANGKSELLADAVESCVTRDEEAEKEEDRKEKKKNEKKSSGGGPPTCDGCGGGVTVTVTTELWECTWAGVTVCVMGDDGYFECWREWVFEGCRRVG